MPNARPTGPSRPLASTAEPPPKPLYGHARPDGWVAITWAMPGLRRVPVASPEHLYRRGVSAALGAAIARSLHELDLQDAAIEASVPGE